MTRILYISCSPKGSASVCRSFAQEVLARLAQRHEAVEVEHRDLAADPPPFVDAAFCAAITDPANTGAAAFAASEALIAQLERADILVIATPMHNYPVPAVLKAWIDQIVRIHRSFASTPSGKVGLLPDRAVYLAVASGGWFTQASPVGTPPQPDFLTPYLRAVLGTIGLHTVTVFALEGVTRGPDAAAAAWARAASALDAVLPERDA